MRNRNSRCRPLPQSLPLWGRWHGEAVTDEVLVALPLLCRGGIAFPYGEGGFGGKCLHFSSKTDEVLVDLPFVSEVSCSPERFSHWGPRNAIFLAAWHKNQETSRSRTLRASCSFQWFLVAGRRIRWGPATQGNNYPEILL